MILYGAPNPAPNPRRVRIFLAEKGIDLPETPLNLMQREHKSDEHRARNSLGQVPTLVLDDGTAISETVAICRYLEETNEGPLLFGESALEKALVDMWIRRVEFQVMAPVGNFWRHAHPRTAALLTQYKDFGEANRATYDNALKWFDRELADRDYVAGDAFSMADICIGLPVPDGFAKVKDWRERVSARPSAKA
jgi:glutathione S-transferase